MHAFMAAVLLWMARLDSLDGNAEPKPPNGESAQVEQTIGRGEGHAVVGTNGSWQARFLKPALKGGKCSLFLDPGWRGGCCRQVRMYSPSLSLNTNPMPSSTIDPSFHCIDNSLLD